MARSHARLLTSIWSNDDFRALPGDAQRVYVLALSQPNLSYCGIVPYTARRWAKLAADTTAKTITRAVDKLIATRFLLLDDETEEVLVRTFAVHDGLLRQPNLVVAMSRDYIAIQSPRLQEAFLQGLPEGLVEGLPDGYPERLDEDFRKAFEHAKPQGSLTRVRARGRADPDPDPDPLISDPSPNPSPPETNDPSNHQPTQPGQPAAPPHGDDETKETGQACSRDGDVWRRLAEHDLEHWLTGGGSITSRRAWLAKAAKNRHDELAGELEAALAGGQTRQAFVDQVLEREAAEDDDERSRRPPGHDETQAMLAAQDSRWEAAQAETASLDGELEDLPAPAFADLQARALDVLGGGRRWPPAMVRAEMRHLHAEGKPT